MIPTAYNTGILPASGEFVAICDDDDEWLPAKLRLQIEALRRDREATVAITGVYVCNGPTHVRLPPKEHLTLDDLLVAPRTVVHLSTFVASRENFLDHIGLFDETITASSYGSSSGIIRTRPKGHPLHRPPFAKARGGGCQASSVARPEPQTVPVQS